MILSAQTSSLAAPDCDRAYSFIASIQSLESAVNTRLQGPVRQHALKFGPEIGQAVSSISSPQDAIQFFKTIESIEARKYKFKSQLGREWVEEFSPFPDLVQIDVAKQIAPLLQQFTKEQKGELIQVFDRISVKSSNLSSREYWKNYANAFRILIEPKNVFSVLERLPDDRNLTQQWVDQPSYASFFNVNMVTAIRSLPVDISSSAKQMVLKKYVQGRDAAVAGTGAEERLLLKTRRRNYELFHRLFHDDAFQLVIKELQGKRTMTVREFGAVWDRFWKLQGLDPSYSFDKVVGAARVLQKGPLAPLLKDDYLELYGSFPNGKALADSDFDVHLGPIMMGDYYKSFTESGSYASPHVPFRGQTPEIAYRLSEQYLAAEKEVAKFLNKSEYEPAEMMTIVAALPTVGHDFFRAEMLAVYNPVIVRVDADRVIARVYDSFGSKRVLEVELVD